MNRNKLLEFLTDPNHERSTLEKTADDYFSLLVGLVKPFEDGEAENKLRRAIKFKWTNTLLGNTPTLVILEFYFVVSLVIFEFYFVVSIQWKLLNQDCYIRLILT